MRKNGALCGCVVERHSTKSFRHIKALCVILLKHIITKITGFVNFAHSGKALDSLSICLRCLPFYQVFKKFQL